MRQLLKSFAILVGGLAALNSAARACEGAAAVCETASTGAFPLIASGAPARVLTDSDADTAILRAARSFAADLERVSGDPATVLTDADEAEGAVVLIASIGESPLLDGLIASGKLTVGDIDDEWEAFKIAVVEEPWPGVPQALVIAGADRRGAVFGAYDVSEDMGVSPWYWFADVPVEQRTDVYITAGERMEKPGVRYRGIFINDEDPALSGWAEKKFGGVKSAMYEHVFELLLRLKGNYLWPAMWAPKSFHLDDPANADLAHEMGVVMGTSHHEPLTRAQDEWHRPEVPHTGGEWNYATNARNLRAFWRGGMERMMEIGGDGRENLLTIGMRGDGDAPLSEGTAIKLLEKVVADQRAIIEQVTGKPASETPQVWALYKEVQDYYDQGMTVPDDVTLLYADDNWGQIRRLPTRDVDRAGGYGVYYHFDYVGAPRSYKWLNTNQIEKVWQQMNLAWERGAKDIWIVNVGDIKPMEYPLDFFMKMAWSPDQMTPEALANFPEEWAERQFGAELAEDIAELVTGFSTLAARRKPELVNEETYAVGEIRRDVLVEGEWSEVVGPWRDLVGRLEAVKPRVPEESRDAFFQLIEYPILAVANLYEMYFATAWNRALASRFDARGNYFMTKVEEAFRRDSELTAQYHSLNGGKWDAMMSQVHMNYVIWNDPTQQTQPTVILTAGDTPVKMRNPVPVFVAAEKKDAPIVLTAANVERYVPAGGLGWTKINDLGQEGAALIVAPQGRPSTSLESAPRVEWDVTLPRNDGIRVKLHLLPTLNTIDTEPLRLAVSLGDGAPQTLEFNLEPTGGAQDTPEKRRWAEAVIENRVVLDAEFPKTSAGKQALKIWRLDDNIILDRVEITGL